jgi:hypothetical protein
MKKPVLVLICTLLSSWLVIPAAAQDRVDRLGAQVEAVCPHHVGPKELQKNID